MPRRRRSQSYTPTRGPLKGRRYKSEKGYREALARTKGFKNRAEERRAAKRQPQRIERRAPNPITEQHRLDAFEILNWMRTGKTDLATAVERFNGQNPDSRIQPGTVEKYVGKALRTLKGQRVAKASDTLLRKMNILTGKGVINARVRGSKRAHELAEYNNAVKKLVYTGDESDLKRFRGKSILAGGKRYPFVTDPKALRALADADELGYESIYEQPT